MVDVPKQYLKIVCDILSQYVGDSEVRAFGSRVRGGVKPYSDLDIAIVGQKKIDRETMIALKEAFEISDIPFRVDIVDWNSILPSFKKIIEERYEVLALR